MIIIWLYAKDYGNLPSGQAEIVEALVEIAEQLNRLNDNFETKDERDFNKELYKKS